MRLTVEESLRVSIALLSRQGALSSILDETFEIREVGVSGAVNVDPVFDGVRVIAIDARVRGRGGGAGFQRIEFQETECNFGGARRWFSCPDCSKRCGTLYLPPGATHLACRECHDLTYRDRLRRRDVPHEILQAIERLSEAEDVLLNGINATPGGRKKLLAGIQAMQVLREYLGGEAPAQET